jgi:16S rRNA pseudouridine516 synthase
MGPRSGKAACEGYASCARSAVPSRGVPRLHELIARNLGCTKTEARRLIEAGEVRGADGVALVDPRLQIQPAALPLAVEIEGQPESLLEHVSLALHKPVGYVTALRDDRHPVAYDLLEAAPLFPHLRPVGRLDLDTSGLLIWTTDGPFLQRLTHPKRAVPRSYHAALARPARALPEKLVLDDGHEPQIIHLAPIAGTDAHPALARPAEATCYAEITIVGGAYHEVRRIFAALESHVLGLCRVSFGRLRLPVDLPAGEFQIIDPTAV